MTLNDHFALKSVSGSATNGLASPAFGQNCSKICRASHILLATKMSPRERSFWQYKVYADIRGGSLGRGRQMRVGSFKMAIFASFVHCLPNILHTWPRDSFQVIRLSMTLGIFQGHWTVLHQISQKRCVIWQMLLIVYTAGTIRPQSPTNNIFPNGCEFLFQILHAYNTFLSTLEYILFNCLQL